MAGDKVDMGRSIAVDAFGNAFVTGSTNSTSFPTTASAFQPRNAGFNNAFVAEFNSTGTLLYSTYFGGGNNDHGLGISVDSSGNVYVTGDTSSADFPISNALQSTLGGGNFPPFDAFLAKMNLAERKIYYSTYLGGQGDDSAFSVAADSCGNAYVTGRTGSSNFPTLNPLQVSISGAFVSKISESCQTDFAQFVNGANWVSSLVITNPSVTMDTGGSAQFIDGNGQPLLLSINGNDLASTVAFTIKPLGRVTLTTDGKGSLVAASVRVMSDIPVAGVVKFSYPGLGITGVGQSLPMKQFMTPVVRDAGSGLNTGIAISNAKPIQVNLTFSLRQTNGQEVNGGSSSVSLAGNGHMAKFIDELFPNASTSTFQGTLIVTATYFQGFDALVSATSLQLGTGGQITTVPVIGIEPAPATKQLFFAQFADGDGWTSSLSLVNPLISTVGAKFAFWDDGGNPLAFLSGQAINLPSFGSIILTSEGKGNLGAGSGRAVLNDGLQGVLTFGAPGLGIAGVGASTPTKGFITPVTRSATPALNTGIAIASLDTPVTVTLTLRDQNGVPVSGGQTTLQLPSNGHSARFIDELLPNANTREFEGTLTVSSTSGNVIGTAIQTGSGLGELTTLPVTPLRQ
jgi:hypothetical protein